MAFELKGVVAAVLVGCCCAERTTGEINGLAPPIAARDTQVIIDIAGIEDASQREVISILLKDFEASVRALNQRVDAEVEAIEAPSFVDSWRVFSAAQSELDGLMTQLVQSLAAMMTPPQRLAFDAYWKANHRATRLRSGRFPGERTNLDLVLNDIESEDRPFRERVAAWQREVDEALKARYTFDVTGVPVLIDLIMTGRHDEALRMATREIDARKRVRDVNDVGIEEISVLMAPGAGADFRERALAAGYPQVFRKDAADRIFAAAVHDEEIASDDRAWLRELGAAYARARAPLRSEHLSVLREAFGARWLAPMQRRVGIEADAEALDVARVHVLLRLRALEHEYLEAICQRVGPDRCTALNGGRFPLPQAPDGWNQPFPTPRADDPVEPPPDAGLEGQDVRPDDPTAADDDPGPPPEWSERGSTSHPGAEPPQGVPDPDPPPG